MNFIKKPILFLAIVLLGMPGTGRAQYLFQLDPFFSYFRDLNRYEIGGGGIMSLGQFSGVVPFSSIGAGLGDTNVNHTFSQFNCLHWGERYPIKKYVQELLT